MVEFCKKDIVRHALVQRIVEAYEKYDEAVPANSDSSENCQPTDADDNRQS